MYVDTDSIIYKRNLSTYTPTLGDFLGEFTNEIDPSEGDHIIEFVSAGTTPTDYSGIVHSKVKGFSLNFAASKKIDFDKIKQIVCHFRNEKIVINQSKIVRDKKDWSVRTKHNDKIYRMVCDKTIIQDNLSTLPYGF